MLQDMVKWFHPILGHPGKTRLKDLVSARYYNPQLRHVIDRYVCKDCRTYKADGQGWGLLPEREVTVEPFADVAVDLIGPWNIKVGSRTFEFNALT